MVNKKKLRKNRAAAAVQHGDENKAYQPTVRSTSIAKLKKARRKQQLERSRKLKRIIDTANYEDVRDGTARNVYVCDI